MTDRKIDVEPGLLNSFQKFGEVYLILTNLLFVPIAEEPSAEENRTEQAWLDALMRILGEYQEQPYLLDPYLERLVTPIVHVLRDHARDYTAGHLISYSFARVNRLAWMIYSFVKVRGHKTIVRFFPHEVSDLPVVVNYMTMAGPVKDENAWALRYIMMLWLSLVCMLPFDLAQFDDVGGSTALKLETIGVSELGKSGLERDGAVLLLSRLYMRKDTSKLLASFIESAQMTIARSPNVFMVIGSLSVLADVTKSAPIELLRPHISHIQDLLNGVSSIETLLQNAIVRKLRTKCMSRIATRLLPVRSRSRRTKYLDPSMRQEEVSNDIGDNEEPNVPSEVEFALGELFELLQDKDTSVRWSSAKGIANISERLPASFVDQIVDNILGHYAVYGCDISPSELPATAEHPWHGATLACAELARRGLISESRLRDMLSWTSKALFFDVQKGSSSVGSSVRDAAAYVVWSIARTRSKQALEPHAAGLARTLVTVALFDREIHIRRAASAAFQENVGRIGLFPHGIQIVGLVDFFSVGIRRNAFLVAAPEVYRYEEYQEAILGHLLNITLRHWDEAMRTLAALSLGIICRTRPKSDVSRVLDHLSSLLLSVDVKDVHGGLVALSELASAIQESEDCKSMQDYRQSIFHLIDSVPLSMVSSPRNHLVTEAACHLIANSLSSTEANSLRGLSTEPYWRTIIFQGLKSRNSNVQAAAAAAIHSLSRFKDCSDDCRRLIKELRRSSGILQQSLARLLGSFDFLTHNNGFDAALSCLLEAVDAKSPSFFRDVEARRNAYTSLATIIKLIASRLDKFVSPDTTARIWQAFLLGLEDYTVSERGDVGSWVRISCIQGLASIFEALLGVAYKANNGAPPAWTASYASFSRYLPCEIYHRAIGMLLKQGVERLDNVRQCVGNVFLHLLTLEPPSCERGEEWSVRGKALFINLLEDTESPGWNDGSWLYPKAVRFLDIKSYREPVLRGLLLSIGSKTSTTQQLASSAMLAYARSLPLTKLRDKSSASDVADSIDLHTLVADTLTIAKENARLNNIVVPVLHVFNVFFDGDVFFALLSDEEEICLELVMKIMELATRNVKRLQSMQRIDESMRIVVNVLCLKSEILRREALNRLEDFLLHPFPKVRSDTAEVLYVALQTKDIAYEVQAEEILLETAWSTDDVDSLEVPVKKLIEYLG